MCVTCQCFICYVARLHLISNNISLCVRHQFRLEFVFATFEGHGMIIRRLGKHSVANIVSLRRF